MAKAARPDDLSKPAKPRRVRSDVARQVPSAACVFVLTSNLRSMQSSQGGREREKGVKILTARRAVPEWDRKGWWAASRPGRIEV
ncbi:hypothetical protein MAPG_01026 [Magnaporthiopsis poae ATCC 64411]|uniref:Uncharacterized protein n=1 Tax=Magnaporthiopsis poae (strain ATCC 64411 / 73-15) TaxID=644358 RepID=A0A0C4DML6_MAGP6|nr:hypothetical protein MAPG_01026 [Magnaporthiopsis poae ATCC 64411]